MRRDAPRCAENAPGRRGSSTSRRHPRRPTSSRDLSPPQVLKGVSDPRRRDEDDAADLARSAKRARGTVQRYLDVLEARGAARLTR